MGIHALNWKMEDLFIYLSHSAFQILLFQREGGKQGEESRVGGEREEE